MTQPNDPRFAAALQDPEYLALLAQLDAQLNNQNAEFDAQGVDIRSQFGRQLRDAGQQLPNDLRRSTESAAGRGMLYAGGLLEQQGDIQRNFANFNAQIGEDQTGALNGLERGRNAARQDYNARREGGLQGAIQRALARAEKDAIVKAEAEKAANPAGGAPVAPGNTVSAPPAAAPGRPNGGADQTGGVGITDGPAAPVAAPAPFTAPSGIHAVTPQHTQAAAASNYIGPNNPTLAPSHTNPILRAGDAPTPNSPLNAPVASPWAMSDGSAGPANIGASVPAVNRTSPGRSPQEVVAGRTPAPAPVAPARPAYAPREMSSFDSKSQTILSLGGTVLAGGTTKVRYDPNTGKVVPVDAPAAQSPWAMSPAPAPYVPLTPSRNTSGRTAY